MQNLFLMLFALLLQACVSLNAVHQNQLIYNSYAFDDVGAISSLEKIPTYDEKMQFIVFYNTSVHAADSGLLNYPDFK